MPQNTAPIFTLTGQVSTDGATGMGKTVLTATGDYTGISANHQLVFVSDATNGGMIKALQFKAIGTNIATVARIYLNNGSANTTATNNTFFDEIALPATTASNTAPTTTIQYVFPFQGLVLNPWFRVYVGVATTVASGWVVSPIGGEY